MPTDLLQGSYTSEGAKGLAKDGGTKRRAAVQEMVRRSHAGISMRPTIR